MNGGSPSIAICHRLCENGLAMAIKKRFYDQVCCVFSSNISSSQKIDKLQINVRIKCKLCMFNVTDL